MQHDSAIKVTIRTPTSTRPASNRSRGSQGERFFANRHEANIDWLAPLLSLPILVESIISGLNSGSSEPSFNPNIKLAFENSRIPSDREKDEKCSICQEVYGDKHIVSLPTCLHNFHKNCIEEAVKYNRTCPICRTDIPVTEN
jgi:hypothetical protein